MFGEHHFLPLALINILEFAGILIWYIQGRDRPTGRHLGVALSTIGFVFGTPVGTLVATSGVVAVIIGLALQNTLADVFSGIALTLGRAYAIDDWIQLSDGTEGRIPETNWRSTNLLTGAHNVALLPNSILAKQGVTNLSRPDETHWISLAVHIAPTHPPGAIEAIMLDILRGCERIIKVPPPTVALKAINARAIEINLQFCVGSPLSRMPAKNEVVDLVYRHCLTNSLFLAMPPESLLCEPAVAGSETTTIARPLASNTV